MNFNTINNFEGHVFVKGMYNEKNCRNDDIGKKNAFIEIPFDMCNVLKTRSLNPKGIFISTTIVISFHSKFITKMDKAYRVQCFYMETEKTVTANIEVSDMTTIVQNYDLPLPVCKYEILNGGPSGEIVTISTIGNLVYHKWTCETENVDLFCMLIHSCSVDDGNGNKIEIINKNGCSVDKTLINNIEYTSDFVGGQLSNVYKYADRPQMYYQCQISINIKELYQSCPRPNCTTDSNYIPQIVDIVTQEDDENIFNSTIFSDPEMEESKIFHKRSLINNDNTLDVRTELTTVDITKEEKEKFCKLNDDEIYTNNIDFIKIISDKNIVCFSTTFFSILGAGMIINFLVLGVILIFLIKIRC
ncbi:Zona pellucida domain-containing protein [Strongyloides ratti]|uniref:Zona pellucida domain-containing protein n=1 Tax=Strongyloides ratti TaxID=34506 RepID=A0A090KUD9_STRRB|nr:Zona pellucida domain-containing protein [Strongyloides ratti]CEF59485.1 Zona pellucida domain-containing protein [Strongyloides ratti]